MGGHRLLSKQRIEASTPAVHHGDVHVWQVRGVTVVLMRKEVSTIDTTGLKSPLLLPPAPCPETISGLLPFRFHAGFRGRGLVLRVFSGFPFFLLTQSTVQCSSVGCMAKPRRSFNLQKRFFFCNYIVSMRGRSFAVQPDTMVFLSRLGR